MKNKTVLLTNHKKLMSFEREELDLQDKEETSETVVRETNGKGRKKGEV